MKEREMSKNTPCPRCGKTNPADVHTCTPKQDQSIDLNPKKPMDGDEVIEGFEATECDQLWSFTEGVRWAEKYHGIGGEYD